MYRIKVIGRSDAGRVRPKNEDTFFINQDAGFCLVADGMGGAAAGETASRIFAQTADEVFSKSSQGSEKDIISYVQNTFQFANDRILAHVSQNPEHQGMGCTAELLAFTQTGYVIGHIGDSRTYRFRSDTFKQLTRDHSLVQDQIDHGLITKEQARHHSMRNIILGAVGVESSLAFDTLQGPVYKDDLFLLCSDGLTDLVDDVQICEVLRSEIEMEIKIDHLIDLANRAGGGDNITVVLAKIIRIPQNNCAQQ